MPRSRQPKSNRLRCRSGGRFDGAITIRAPFGGGVRAPELHQESLVGQLSNVPGLKVICPGSAADAKGLLASAIRDPDPVVFLEPLKGYRLIRDDVPEGDYLVPLGVAAEVRPGTDLVVVTWSAQVEVAKRAAAAVAEQTGASIGVLDLRSLVPLDLDGLIGAVEALRTSRRCGRSADRAGHRL